ncbi:MAG: Hsp20/alpha crystallin family protein [Candidatus Yanofskybacteria bacterium]|nr:Hsp20/alpha crystallin family protein [Candidatus Yanofskybacteria bacterium]
MKITKYDYPFNPFKEIERFFDEDVFGFVPAMKRRFEPPMDIYQTDSEFVVELQVPKTLAEKVNVEVEDGILKIAGEQEEVKEDEGRHYFRREIRKGSFQRMIALPVPVKEDEAKAVFENGVLKISIPKTEVKQPKKVNIEVK